jgi:hypothetical protein
LPFGSLIGIKNKNKEALLNFKGLSEDEGWAKFAGNLRPSPFFKDLSNETTFSLIHLAMWK